MFLVYVGKCSSRKAVHSLVQKRCKYFAEDEDVDTEARKWLRQQLNDFYAADFDALVKRWGKCMKAGVGHVEK
jgi:hypothetical protein